MSVVSDQITSALCTYLPLAFDAHRNDDYVSFHRALENIALDIAQAIELAISDAMPHQHTWMYDDEPGRYRCDCGEILIDK